MYSFEIIFEKLFAVLQEKDTEKLSDFLEADPYLNNLTFDLHLYEKNFTGKKFIEEYYKKIFIKEYYMNAKPCIQNFLKSKEAYQYAIGLTNGKTGHDETIKKLSFTEKIWYARGCIEGEFILQFKNLILNHEVPEAAIRIWLFLSGKSELLDAKPSRTCTRYPSNTISEGQNTKIEDCSMMSQSDSDSDSDYDGKSNILHRSKKQVTQKKRKAKCALQKPQPMPFRVVLEGTQLKFKFSDHSIKQKNASLQQANPVIQNEPKKTMPLKKILLKRYQDTHLTKVETQKQKLTEIPNTLQP